MTELLAESRLRKWLLPCLLNSCRYRELRPGLGAAHPGNQVPSSGHEAMFASCSWPGDYCLSFAGTENPFSDSDAIIYHG